MVYPWQKSTWQQFRHQYQQGRVPHAIILTGVQGLGQAELADQIASLMHCQSPLDSSPCGQCHSCQLLTAGNHPDHSSITPEEVGKQIKIEQIRALQQKQTLTATISQWKTAILMPADAMNNNASNSLLKLLEEPQQNTLLILISSEVTHLPITILSRCQKMPLPSPTVETSLSWIQQQGEFSHSEIEQALVISKSAPLAALALLTDNSLAYLEQVSRDFTALIQDKANPIQLAQQWQHYDLKLVLNYLQFRLKERIIANSKQENLRSNSHNWLIYDCIIKTIKLLFSSNNINKALLIEQFMVSVMNKPTSQNTALNRES